MKRTKFFSGLACVLLICLGLAAETFASAGDAGDAMDSLAVVREYGEPNAILDSIGKFSSVLRYPRTGIDAADRAIYEWASGLYNSVKKEAFALGKPNEPEESELDVAYSAFKVKDKYVGIEEIGYLSGPFLAHPADIIKTFNIDIKGKKLLTIGELPNHNVEKTLALLKEKVAERYPDNANALEDIDKTWLTYWVMKPSGVDVLLPRGEFLPSYLGLLRFTLTYGELEVPGF
jgi:hypothetical protein